MLESGAFPILLSLIGRPRMHSTWHGVSAMIDSMILLSTDHHARLTPLLLEAMQTRSTFLLTADYAIASALAVLLVQVHLRDRHDSSPAVADREHSRPARTSSSASGKSREVLRLALERRGIHHVQQVHNLLWNACRASVTAYGMTEFDSSDRSLGTSIFSSIARPCRPPISRRLTERF